MSSPNTLQERSGGEKIIETDDRACSRTAAAGGGDADVGGDV